MNNKSLYDFSPEKLKIINVESIRYFVVLAETSNFSTAAQRLNITQQALSKAIANIESHLKIRLIERKGKNKGLTEEGKLFLEKSISVLQELYNINRFFSEYKSEKPKGNITVAWSSFWGVYVLPKILYKFMENFAEIFPKIYMLSHENIETKVSNGEIEIGLLINPPNKKELDYLEGPKIPYVIVGKPQPLKKWHELEYIVPGHITRTNKGSDFWDDDIYPRKIIAEINSLQTSLSLCELGKGAIFVPEIIVRDKIEKGELAIVAECPFELFHHLFVIWNKNIYQTSAVREFVKEIKMNVELK